MRTTSESLLIIIGYFVVSGKPPLFVIIGTDPLLQASTLALPKGSSQREQITDMLVFSNFLRINF